MPTYLTPELEQLWKAGQHGFEGSANELDELLLEGLNSGDPLDADGVWRRITAHTDQMLGDMGTAKLAARLNHSVSSD